VYHVIAVMSTAAVRIRKACLYVDAAERETAMGYVLAVGLSRRRLSLRAPALYTDVFIICCGFFVAISTLRWRRIDCSKISLNGSEACRQISYPHLHVCIELINESLHAADT
jgi:hypothetical protein